MKYSITSQPQQKVSLNANHPLSRGLVGFWLLNENGGVIATESTHFSNDGILTNGPVFTDFSQRGKSVKFDGSNDHIICANNDQSRNFAGAFTLSAWVYPMAYDASGFGQIIMKNTANSNYYGLVLQANGSIYFQSNGFVQSATGLITLNNWYHIVGYRDSSNNLRIVLNGVLLAPSQIGSGTITSTSDINIGRDPVNGRYFNGYIQNVMIYNRQLTFDEILTLYRTPYSMFMSHKIFIERINMISTKSRSYGYIIT